ncbi:MAG: serine protease [Albidovulum sp.]
MRLVVFLFVYMVALTGGAAFAQDRWIQIEAQPSLSEGEARARAYAGVFPNVAGFRMNTGWYAVALGPYEPLEADQQLRLLKGERLIPSDSYIAFPSSFTQQFWPVGAPAPAPEATTEVIAAPEPILPSLLPDETPAEARRSEALLSSDERMFLQEALQWGGYYTSAIDGSFGAGTRRSMAAWQTAQGYESTGILTTAQRLDLTRGYTAEREALGLKTVLEEKAGIEIPLPLALVEFERYRAPFVQYREKDGSGFRVMLISQKGDTTTLAGLYDVMQTLEIVPVSGERKLNRTSFVLTGQNAKLHSHTEVSQSDGALKGFTLIWRPEDAAQARKVLDAMKAGFKPAGAAVLDDSVGQSSEDHAGLMAGLEIRKPVLSRSGFWLNGQGLVATTDEVLASCARITLDSGPEAEVAHVDEASGLVILKPNGTLSPSTSATLALHAGRIGSEIAVAGYSYGDALDAAVLSFGTLADTRGLGGEDALTRLTVSTLEGDAGGPVLDHTGQVIGMLLPRSSSGNRTLPADVSMALDADAIQSVVTGAGLAEAKPAALSTPATMAPEDLAILGRDMTVLVSCWN